MDLKSIADEMRPKSTAARDWVFQVIRAAIVRGILPGGMPLRQDEVSAALSVSHIPVREAFRQLEAQGLVRTSPNRGAIVTQLSREEMEQVMDVRILLELGALRKAVINMSDEVIEIVEGIHSQMLDENDTNHLEDLNLQLHAALYLPAENRVLSQYIEQLHANVDRYVRPFYSDMQIYRNSSDEHRQLIDACKARDVELAGAILRTHLETTKVLLLNSPTLSD